MATTYNIYFGPVDNMTLRSEGQADTTFNMPIEELVHGDEYEWRIDSINEYGTTYGEVWSFIAIALAPPVDIVTTRYLVAAANGKIWYEDI